MVHPLRVGHMGDYRARVVGALRRAGWPEPLWFPTTAADPGPGQARKAVEAGVDVVFVAGGDGTVKACVGELVGTDVALAVLPAGTGNLLAVNLGLSDQVEDGIAIATAGGRRRLDVGVVGEHCFVVMAGMGFDAKMIGATSERTKAAIGWPAYVFGGLRHLADRPMRVSIRLDGQKPMRREARAVLIANVGRLQGGVRLLTDAEPDDGRLDVAVLTPRTVAHWWSLGWAVLRRRDRVPGMEVYTARRVQVISDRPQARQLDGDLIEPHRALRVSVRPRALTLCVPEPAQAPDLAEGGPEGPSGPGA
ncbi:MAG TPA: diacylglycerol kinase family protein [Micromonosporaceae bacterium]|nr:diacylglycerol kinase family protein [Micromonosporaceae bacterium]